MSTVPQASTKARRFPAWPVALFCCLLWGSAFPCIKIGYRLFEVASGDYASQILFAGCRFAVAGVLVIVIGSLMRRRLLLPRKSAIKPITLLALTQTAAQYLFFYIGVAHTGGVNSSIINGAGTAVTNLTACLIFRCEKLTPKKAIGCVLGFGGVLLLNLTGGVWAFAWNGEGFVLLATFASAVSTVLIKRFSADHDPVMLSGWQFFVGGILLVLCGVSFGGRLSPQSGTAYLLFLYLAALSATAYTLWGLLLKSHPVSGISAYKCATPLFGALLSACLLGEVGKLLQWQVPLSLLLVVASVLCINYTTTKQ